MRKRQHLAIIAAALGIASGCGSAYAKQYVAASALEPATAFDCAQRVVSRLGYTVEEANRDAGLVRARTPQPIGMNLGTGQAMFGEITVTVLRGSGTQISVTANQKAHADSVLADCAR